MNTKYDGYYKNMTQGFLKIIKDTKEKRNKNNKKISFIALRIVLTNNTHKHIIKYEYTDYLCQ